MNNNNQQNIMQLRQQQQQMRVAAARGPSVSRSRYNFQFIKSFFGLS